jgi:PAS domain S-box-containing protein
LGAVKGQSLVNHLGRVEGVVGIINDIDAQKQVEAALKATQARYENTIRSLPCGLYDYVHVLGGQGEFRFFSQRSEEIFELGFVELQENPALFWEMVHAEDLEQLVNIDIEKNRSGELFVSEFRINTRSGKTKWVRLSSLPNEALPGDQSVWSGFILDISHQKEMEQALLEQEIILRLAGERERMMEDMHDGFGSQLTSARIRAENNDLSQAEIVDLLRECMADLYLVTDIFSHHEDSFFQALINMRHRYERLNLGLMEVKLKWNLQLEHLPALDSRTILQILRIIQEVLTNALKHDNAQTIEISACYTDNERLTISVVDDGQGLPADIQLGQGLLNMKKRARELGAQYELISLHRGTWVLLVLPVSCAEQGRL